MTRRAETAFDYGAKVDLFVSRSTLSRRAGLEFRSFRFARDAIRYVMEELPRERLGSICMEIDEKRFDGDAIRRLYESSEYPFERKQVIARRRKRPANSASAGTASVA